MNSISQLCHDIFPTAIIDGNKITIDTKRSIEFDDNTFVYKHDDLGIRFYAESMAYQFLERKVLPNYIMDRA